MLSLVLTLCIRSGPLAAQPAPEFTGIQQLTNRETLLRLSGATGVSYRIDAATNLPEWSSLLTLFSTGVHQHTDSATPYLSSRYYRAEQLVGTNHLTGDHLVTTNGDVVFHPVNHASFVMSWNGKVIYNDPVGGATPYLNFPRADLILVSHFHGDHFDVPTLQAVRKTNGIIIASLRTYNDSLMTASLRSNTIVLGYGSSTNVIGLTVQAVPGYNSRHLYTTNNAYLLTISDKRILMSGDTGDVAEIRGLTNIDVAFVCINLPFTMNVDAAASMVRQFRPKVVYPYHYIPSTPPTDLNQFKRLVGTDLGIEVRLRNWY
jgi:L-ascorbate metabolism protein UlaG (beta-lactamase superfamily)